MTAIFTIPTITPYLTLITLILPINISNMFKGTQETAPNNKEVETIIGPSVKVEGDFKGEGNVVVEGTVIGSLMTKQNLQVLERATITANVEAENAVIGGKVKGNVTVRDRLELTATAHIHGDVEAKVLSIAPGAILNGRCTVRHEEPAGHKVAEREVKGVKLMEEEKATV